MCREGQFEEGKRSLCVGLDVDALKSADIYKCYIGSNKKVYYEIDTVEALKFASEHTMWKNPKGRYVAILPLDIFERKSNEQRM